MGGTHGNEMSGLAILHPDIQSQLKTHSQLNIQFEVGNPKAVEHNVRFTEEDLNRQFTPENLAENATNQSFEAQRARKLHEQWATQTDLVIDVHNTTAAMGATLIILTLDDFHIGLARYVKQQMPEAHILVEDEKPVTQHPYLCTLGKIGVMVEVGAQPQGVCRADISELSIRITQHIVNFCERFNKNPQTFKSLPSTQAYRLSGTVFYPENSNKTGIIRDWTIHPQLQDADYHPLHKGDPVFLSHNGQVKVWEEETSYPHFINEAAYHKSNVAFATADLIEV